MNTGSSKLHAVFVVLLLLGGCGSAAAPRVASSVPVAGSSVICFALGSDWEAAGAFDSMFFASDGEMLDGIAGLTLHLSPYYLAVELAEGVDGEAWLRALPESITGNPAVKSVQFQPTRFCEGP